jgi:8-amino-7-oxononanoate synthase
VKTKELLRLRISSWVRGFVAAIRPPTVPRNTARLRLSLRLDVLDEMDKIKSAFQDMKRAGI